MRVKTVKTFYNQNTKKYLGFAGKIKLYDKEVYVDTRSGTGYDKVIEELNKYIDYLSYKYNLSNLGFSIEDTKQHIIMRILEGIPKYNPYKNTALSTFLHTIIERRIINEVRDASVDSKNPTVLRTTLYSVVCECGHKFMISMGNDELFNDYKCYCCSRTIDKAKIFSVNVPPESIHSVFIVNMKADDTDGLSAEDIISDESFDIPLVFGKKQKLDERMSFMHDIEKWIKSENKQMQKLIELVCFKDYSIKAAAKIIGISPTSANNKLKRLKRKKIVRDILNR